MESQVVTATPDALMQNLTIDSGSGTAVDASERVSADMVFTRWPKIGQMQDAVKAASWMFATKEEAQLSGKAERAVWADAEGKNAVKMPTTLQFKAKVKVDGTNGGVILSRTGNGVGAQSRSRLLTKDQDNCGFHAWVTSTEGYWLALAAKLPGATIFGEWAGTKINNNNQAVVKIGRRVFAVFGIRYRDNDTIDVCPERIRTLLPEHPDIFVLPWCATVDLDFSSRDSLEAGRTSINQLVWDVERVDPWVQQNFGIEGKGEGVVMYRSDCLKAEAPASLNAVVPYMFKAKAEYARVVRQDAPTQIDTSVFKNFRDFAEAFVTRARVEQAMRETLGESEELSEDSPAYDKAANWLVQDILEESKAEIAASNFDGKKQVRSLTYALRDMARIVLMEIATERAFDKAIAVACNVERKDNVIAANPVVAL